MKKQRIERLRQKLFNIEKSKFAEIPSIIYETDTEDEKISKLKYMEDYRNHYVRIYNEFNIWGLDKEKCTRAKLALEMIRERSKEVADSYNRSQPVPKYFIDLSGVKTPMLNKDIARIVTGENIKIKIGGDNGRIKVSLVLNDIKIYKILGKKKSLLKNREKADFINTSLNKLQ